jgi:hypothetical protein
MKKRRRKYREFRLSCHVNPDVILRQLTSGTRSPDETDGVVGSVTTLYVSDSLQILYMTKSLTRNKRGWKKQRYRKSIPLHLNIWWMTNSTSVHFVRKTLPGDTPVVGTLSQPLRWLIIPSGMIIPSVSTSPNHTGPGLVVQCHMTSQIKDNGKQSRVTDVYSMESKKDDPLKGRFLVVKKEIHN